jgi:hypothetical protein
MSVKNKVSAENCILTTIENLGWNLRSIIPNLSRLVSAELDWGPGRPEVPSTQNIFGKQQWQC